MNVLRETTIYPVKVKLEARDRYNDYSVIFDHFITVNYGNGREQRFDVGTDVTFALSKYEAAVGLVWRYSAEKQVAA